MLSSGGRRRFRAATVVLVWLLAVSGCVVLPAAAPSNPVPGWVAELAGGPKPDPEPVRESESAPTQPVASNAVPAAEVRFPEPASWRVTLGEAGTPATVATDTVTGTDAKPDELPVSVTRRTPAAGESLRIDVLDRESARRVNASAATANCTLVDVVRCYLRRFVNRTTRYVIVSAFAAMLALPAWATSATAHDTRHDLGELGFGRVTNNHTRVSACDTSADGLGIKTEYQLAAGGGGSVSDGNGSQNGCSAITTGTISKYRVCATQNRVNITCNAWRGV